MARLGACFRPSTTSLENARKLTAVLLAFFLAAMAKKIIGGWLIGASSDAHARECCGGPDYYRAAAELQTVSIKYL
jgi:hypothetical protein